MSKIFELFGHPLTSSHPDAVDCRTRAWCPFMESECDGGGNRHLSVLQLSDHPQLAQQFLEKEAVQVGVCSLLVNGKPWIVCPRRLFVLRDSNRSQLQARIREALIQYSGLDKATEYRAWSEVKIKFLKKEKEKSFDYTFDYVLSGRCRKSLSEISKLVQKNERECEKIAIQNNFTLERHAGEHWVVDFPADPVVIVEVMTSSTSGGNKKNRTRIGMAFEDAILKGDDHEGPGINYRQVWARMASQLIVKSQVGLAWGGKTIWIVQDALADYISSSTGLDLQRFISNTPDEVNILSFGYGDDPEPEEDSGIVPLCEPQLYAGPVSSTKDSDKRGGFTDIITIGVPPPKEHLWRSLFRKSPCGSLNRT